METSLAQLKEGENAIVVKISHKCSPISRRRLLDFGFVKDTPIVKMMRSPLGNPSAYLVRNTLIAIRDQDAEDIIVSIVPNKNMSK